MTDLLPSYTWDEMAAVDALVRALREESCAVFTATSLPKELARWEFAVAGDQRPALASAVAKLRQEPRAKLAAWLAGKADWTNLDGERFGLVYSWK